MAEELEISRSTTKKDRYESLMPQLKALIKDEPDLVANLANISAALKQTFDFLWVGFYLVKGDELVLGPFQGPVACTRISRGKGVCGTAWAQEKTIIVQDVEKFPGHIACSSLSRSEIVVPVFKKGVVSMVLDADSEKLAGFDETDARYLQEISALVEAITND